MLARSVALPAILSLLPGSAALRNFDSKSGLSVAEECSEAESYEKVDDECYDLSGNLAASKCCEPYDACMRDVEALAQACAVRIDLYMDGCDLLPEDTSTAGSEHGELKVVSSARLCSRNCRSMPELAPHPTLARLPELETRCSPYLERVRGMIGTVQNLDAAWQACPPEKHRPKWGKPTISTNFVDGYDLRRQFESSWRAIPVSFSQEFRIQGTVGAIQDELLMRPKLHISCPAKDAGGGVHLVVGKLHKSAAREFEHLLLHEFLGMSLGHLTLKLGGKGLTEAADVAKDLVHNPTKFSLDKLVKHFMENVHTADKRTLKKYWRWLSDTETDAFLTLADPKSHGYVGRKVHFKCTPMLIGGEMLTVATWQGQEDVPTIVTAKHLAFLITALA